MRPRAALGDHGPARPLPSSLSDRCERAAAGLAAAREMLRANEVQAAVEVLEQAKEELADERQSPLSCRLSHERAIAELALGKPRDAVWHVWLAQGIYPYGGHLAAERWWILGRLRWQQGELPGAQLALHEAARSFRAMRDPRSEIWIWVDLSGLAAEAPLAAAGAIEEIARGFADVERLAAEPQICQRLAEALEGERGSWANLRRLQQISGGFTP